MNIKQDVLPWEVFTIVAIFLAMLLIFSIVRWLFRPRPKSAPIKRLILFLLCLGVVFYAYRTVPDFSTKFQQGLNHNSASTAQANPQFPELLSPRYDRTQSEMIEIIKKVAGQQRGWKVTKYNDTSIEVEINVMLGLFTDILRVSLVPEGNQTRVDMQSSSQKLSFDLGSNRRHIRQFIHALDANLGIPDTH